MQTRSRAYLLLLLSFAAGCPCEVQEDPGDCWVEVGDLRAVTHLGWNDDVLVAGNGSGDLFCWDGASWTASSLPVSAPVSWISEARDGTTLPTIYVATEVGTAQSRLFEGSCAQGWTERTVWQDTGGGAHSLPGTLVDIHNEGPNLVMSLTTEIALSADGGLTFLPLGNPIPPSGALPTQTVVDAAGHVFAEHFPGLFYWDGTAWSSLAATGAAASAETVAFGPGGNLLVFSNTGDDVDVSADTGQNWTSPVLPSASNGLVVAVSSNVVQSGKEVFAAKVGAVVDSPDDGLAWETFMSCWPTSGMPVNVTINDLDQEPIPSWVYLATSAGVFRENGNRSNPCYDPGACLPSGPFCRVGRPGGDPTLEETPWPDGGLAPVQCPDAGCDTAFDGLKGVTGEVAGEVLVTHAAGVDRIPVTGAATFVTAPCDGEVCPFELADLQLDADAEGEGLLGYLFVDLSSTLTEPAKGGWRPETGEVLVAGSSFSADTTYTAGWWGGGALGDPVNPLEEAVSGALDKGRLTLTTRQEVEGAVVTATLTVSTR